MTKKNNKKITCFACQQFFDKEEISYPESEEYEDKPICQQCLAEALRGSRILKF